MVEDEARKHANAVIKIMREKEAGWWHKLKYIFIEVLIIVFAVTVSIWFHNWIDSLQEQKAERVFLTGFRKDLYGDIENIQNSLNFYQTSFKGMQYFAKVGAGDTVSSDSIKKYTSIFFSSTNLQPHVGRYEGLKSSGKLDIIEDAELQNKIIELNEGTLSQIQMLDDSYLKYIEKTGNYIQQSAQLNQQGSITNVETVFRASQWRFLVNYGQSTLIQNVIPAHVEGLKKCHDLIAEIDSELK